MTVVNERTLLLIFGGLSVAYHDMLALHLPSPQIHKYFVYVMIQFQSINGADN